MNCIALKNGRYLYLDDYNTIINNEIKDFFLRHANGRKLELQEPKIDRDLLESKTLSLKQLLFEVTQGCTLKCKYCIFGDAYKEQRDPSLKKMNFETARKGIDYIYGLLKNRENKELTLSFYGGEPFMNFPLIKEIFSYAGNVFKGWKLKPSATSNLTILNDEIIKFLLENDFELHVSLDGPKEHHDAKRVFHDGGGSFDVIMENLEKIRRADEEYFKKIVFIAVFSNDLSYTDLHLFFSRHPLIKDNIMRINGVNQYGTDYYIRYPYDKKRLLGEIEDLLELLKKKIIEDNPLSPVERFMRTQYRLFSEALQTDKTTTLANSCLFDSRLYIDAGGRFHVCERMNDKFPFGDVDRGLDFEKMKSIADDFKTTVREYCSDCEVRHLCDRCFATFAGDGVFKPDPHHCAQLKKNIAKRMETWLDLKQTGVI